MPKKFSAILFDLDGTLLDTAEDLTYALNQLRSRFGLPPVPVSFARHYAGLGAMPILQQFLANTNIPEAQLREEYLAVYQNCLALNTNYFDGMETVLLHIERLKYPWGIVTNKPAFLTLPLLDALSLSKRAGCVVCGDTLPQKKPDPEPLWHACSLLNTKAGDCLYVGDAMNDILAGKNAGMTTALASYGYLPEGVDHTAWKADFTLKTPLELLEILCE